MPTAGTSAPNGAAQGKCKLLAEHESADVVHSGWLERALELVRQGGAHAAPNPGVGAIIVGSTDALLGAGHTHPPGGPHAEITALRDAVARGNDVAGATAYVTLEPCSHHGRTGPCCDALIAAGIRKVVASIEDPNPLVAGQGFARLRAAGVEVIVGPGAEESRELNLGFFSRMVRKTPWVRLKVAASLDGRTALPDGRSQWITSDAARADGHAWRARAGAVVTGIGTVLHDDPVLNVRGAGVLRQPALVIVDSQLQTPLDARLFIADRAVWVYAAARNDVKQAALEARGATVTYLPNDQGRVDLRAMLADLARREINDVHVEAGLRLNGALVRDGLVDELLLYLAPKLLGAGLGMAGFGPPPSLDDALQLDYRSVDRIGEDVRIVARVRGRDRF